MARDFKILKLGRIALGVSRWSLTIGIYFSRFETYIAVDEEGLALIRTKGP
jgi:hypothetical protein